MKFFNARKAAYHTNPKLIDEAIYTPYVYDPPANSSDFRQSRNKMHSRSQGPTGDLLGIPELRHEESDDVGPTKKNKFDTTATEAEIFLFAYGTVVIWGMTEPQEKRFLSSM
jgi:uncharacterized Rmd1/YagE family protein